MYQISKAFQVNDKSVDLITLSNKRGMVLKLLSYGAAVVELLVPDKKGISENIVLTYQNIEDYIENPPYFGVTLGRTAGRINEGCFQLDGQLYELEKNFGPNHCHGGAGGFSHQVWDYQIKESNDEIAVEFRYLSKDGEENYPGELEAAVTYILRYDNTLAIDYKTTSNKKTLCNLSNHSYFNLSGNCKRPITDQYIRISSKYFLELNHNLIQTGRLIDVAGTPMDFGSLKLVGQDINKDYPQLLITNGYDHPWLLEGEADQVEMYDRESGRKMNITTTYPCVVVYSFNFPSNEKLSCGKLAQKHDGICFETQYEPDGINSASFNKAILQPGEHYYHKTEYKFSIER
jgi:aldose 1-epimerase